MKQKGFTLLELLVVISIIGLLSTTALVALSNARNQSKDAKRLSDLKEFSKGLEFYYDTYGVYPCGIDKGSTYNFNAGGTMDTTEVCGDPSDPMAPGFLNGIINDPSSNCCFNGNIAGPCGIDLIGDPQAGGLASEGILNTSCPTDPVNRGNQVTIFMYYAYHTPFDRQSYLLATYLETKQERMQEDGGLCDDAYEIGFALGIIRGWVRLGDAKI